MPRIISADELTGLIAKGGVVLLDASWVMCPKGDAAEWHKNQTRFDFYTPEQFQALLRYLGVNQGDTLVTYARGPMAGMSFAARAAFVLELYGLAPLVLNGGLTAWKGDVESAKWTAPPPGNITINTFQPEGRLATFDELYKGHDQGNSTFDNLDKINYLDCRPKEMFDEGKGAILGPKSTGYHLKGASHFGNGRICGDQGLVDDQQIKQVTSGLKPGVETVTACNTGLGASLAWLALRHVGIPAKMFNGSMTEIAARDSSLINEK
ncbi:unnamed protein product, partial [Mesorhabditis spiculigera]